MRVREARSGELVDVRSVFDAAMLDVPDLDDCAVLVAVEEARPLGALAVAHVDGSASPTGADTSGDDHGRIRAVAVRPGRRGQGVGTALVEAAAERHATLLAEFDERVRPFYKALGFAVGDADGDRLRGRR